MLEKLPRLRFEVRVRHSCGCGCSGTVVRVNQAVKKQKQWETLFLGERGLLFEFWRQCPYHKGTAYSRDIEHTESLS